MRKQVRVLHAEAGEHDVEGVRLAVAVRVFVELQIVAVLHVAGVAIAPRAGCRAGWRGRRRRRWIGESTRGNLRIQRLPRIDEHLVLAFARIHRLGGGGVFIRIDGILERGLRPHPAALIEINADEFAEAFALLHDEFDFVAFGEVEELLSCSAAVKAVPCTSL
jgi:hypothetical protein